jgi:hypothetical protein
MRFPQYNRVYRREISSRLYPLLFTQAHARFLEREEEADLPQYELRAWQESSLDLASRVSRTSADYGEEDLPEEQPSQESTGKVVRCH